VKGTHRHFTCDDESHIRQRMSKWIFYCSLHGASGTMGAAAPSRIFL